MAIWVLGELFAPAGELHEDGRLFGAVDEAEEAVASLGGLGTEAFEVAIEGYKGGFAVEEGLLRQFGELIGGVGRLGHLGAPAVHIGFEAACGAGHEGDVAFAFLVGAKAQITLCVKLMLR